MKAVRRCIMALKAFGTRNILKNGPTYTAGPFYPVNILPAFRIIIAFSSGYLYNIHTV